MVLPPAPPWHLVGERLKARIIADAAGKLRALASDGLLIHKLRLSKVRRPEGGAVKDAERRRLAVLVSVPAEPGSGGSDLSAARPTRPHAVPARGQPRDAGA